MQVWSGWVTGWTYITNLLSFFNTLSCWYAVRTHMSVQSRTSVTMVNNNTITIPRVPSGKSNRSRISRNNCCSVARTNIRTCMTSPNTRYGIFTSWREMWCYIVATGSWPCERAGCNVSSVASAVTASAVGIWLLLAFSLAFFFGNALLPYKLPPSYHVPARFPLLQLHFGHLYTDHK